MTKKNEENKLLLNKCLLDPKGPRSMARPLRVIAECKNCEKCGWNIDVATQRAKERIGE